MWASSIDMWTVWEHVVIHYVWVWPYVKSAHLKCLSNGTYFPLHLKSTPEARPASSQPVASPGRVRECLPGHGPALSGVHCSQPRREQLCGPVH